MDKFEQIRFSGGHMVIIEAWEGLISSLVVVRRRFFSRRRRTYRVTPANRLTAALKGAASSLLPDYDVLLRAFDDGYQLRLLLRGHPIVV